MKTLLNSTRRAVVVLAALAIAACSDQVTRPNSPSTLLPSDVNKSLIGIVDGTYAITIDPTQSYTLPLGSSYMTLPANAICKLATSGYGTQYWNAPCTPETLPVTISATIRNAQTDNPSVDFQPALRFNPSVTVSLHIAVSNAATLSNMTVMKYCPDGGLTCYDEAKTDTSLVTTIDRTNNIIWRRIKHFSGYLVAE